MPRERSPKELLEDLCRRDHRFPWEAYDFLYASLGFTQQQLRERGLLNDPKNQHVTGQQLAQGFRDFALQEFGLMSWAVLRAWNIRTTDDIGELLYNLIDLGLMDKSESDRKEDFHQVFDLEADLKRHAVRWAVAPPGQG